MTTFKVNIRGLVQGVGFRPFIYRMAMVQGLKGEVENNNEGVSISVSTDRETLDEFLAHIRSEAPVASRIDSVNVSVAQSTDYPDFRIVASEDVSSSVTGVSPDIAVCDECLNDLKKQEHRLGYPFINCTNCGPRFTIIKDLPYDRAMTTMSEFVMCEQCSSEYSDVLDRRFHAQPVACNNCGPVYSVGHEDNRRSQSEIISLISGAIDAGKIVAIKGMGGFHLVCDAHNESAVYALRHKKQRESKPFAIMCRSADVAHKVAEISGPELLLLKSWKRPVVITKSKGLVAEGVSNGLDTLGVILPYMPIHYLIFEELDTDSIVFTSANISDEPVITDNNEALVKLNRIADMIITYNREIHNRADDSVAMVMAHKPVLIRRSRGYTPTPVNTGFNTEGIFAAGSELANAFAIGKGSDAILSQYIGDIKNQATFDFYNESYLLMKRLFRFVPDLIVRDMHPDYLSSGFADSLAKDSGAEIMEVQHHHAHIASCMAENMLGERVIGLSLDGVGLGSDGNIWGGEILVSSYTGFERMFHFDYVPILGADSVSQEPWRSGISYLVHYGLLEKAFERDIFHRVVNESDIKLYIKGLERGLNTHKYSSAGRLFDAVASITGLIHRSGFHAEAPMRLEAAIDVNEKGYYDFTIEDDSISFEPLLRGIIEDTGKMSAGLISAKFHATVLRALLESVKRTFEVTGIKDVVLSGGTFQNRWLVSNLSYELNQRGFSVFTHRDVPPNDNGLALGQLVIAAATRNERINQAG